MEVNVTGLFRQIFRKQLQSDNSQYVQVWVGGRYVKLTPSQARRYRELTRTDQAR
jgi:hypothetical protein